MTYGSLIRRFGILAAALASPILCLAQGGDAGVPGAGLPASQDAVSSGTEPAAALDVEAAAQAGTAEQWELLGPLVIETLDNGMTFLIYPNKRAPVFSGVVRFDVGGKDEALGETGIAHMFEHMAFKGTRVVGTRDWQAEQRALERVEQTAAAYDNARNEAARPAKNAETAKLAQEKLAAARKAYEAARDAAAGFVIKDEFDEIYTREGGGDMNATTSQDATTYFISLPSNRLELWARMESSRLADPVLREFYSERDVVAEERRMRQDNNPMGQLWELTMATAYVAHPYGYPTIGWEFDIANLSADRARKFYRTHYTPDRAVGVLVGDIDVEQARRILRETFGKLPARQSGQEAGHPTPEPPQRGERRAVLNIAATPGLIMGCHKPPVPDPADVRAEVLGQVLTGGRGARWFERFVKNEGLAADVSTFTGPGDAAPNMFLIYANAREGHTLDEVERALREAAEELKTQPVSAEELTRAKKNLRANLVRALETNLGLAQRLAEATLLTRDPYYLERRLRQLEAVTAEDLMEFAKSYMVDSNLTVGRLEPPPAAAEPGVEGGETRETAKAE